MTELMATAPKMLKEVSGLDLNQLIKGLTRTKDAEAPKVIVPADVSVENLK
ncbi:hypothetical protein D3C71_2252770 [compost metagenome]